MYCNLTGKSKSKFGVVVALLQVASMATVATADDIQVKRRSSSRSTDGRVDGEQPSATGGRLSVTFLDRGGAVGISGATLFRDFFEFGASSNDWINANCDFDCFTDAADCSNGMLGDECDPEAANCANRGHNPDRVTVCGMLPVDRLVNDLPTVGSNLSTFWLLNYRAVGSTNGIQDFVNSQVAFLNSYQNSPFAPLGEDDNEGFIGERGNCPQACQDLDDQIWTNVCGDGNACGGRCRMSCVCAELGIAECSGQAVAESMGCTRSDCSPSDTWYPSSRPSEQSNLNRQRYYDPDVTDACIGDFTPDPDCPESCTPYCMTLVDLASTDVPVSWALETGEQQDAQWDRTPTESGYGRNPVKSNTGFSNRLKNFFFDANGDGVVSASETLNNDVGSPNGRTVFNNFLAHSIVAFITNRGTGVSQANQTDLQHFFVSGRFKNGLNLVAATRDSGSGTRNIAMNGIGVDSSWGRGDNVGDKIKSSTLSSLGPNTQRSNCGGSSIMENGVMNHRLAMGYTGAVGASRAAADVAGGKFEVIALRDDVAGSKNAQFVRPTKNNILDNSNPDTSYRVAGEQTLASRGNLNANRRVSDLLFDGGAPRVLNQPAADYLLNIIDSAADFDPNFPEQQFLMPGQLLSQSFFSPQGVDYLPLETNPAIYVPTPGFNQALQDFMKQDVDGILPDGLNMGSGTAHNGDMPDYGSVSIAGRTPKRNSPPDFAPEGPDAEDRYSDGSIGGEFCYFDGVGNAAPPLIGGRNLSEANQLTGDFNLDGVRDLNDVPGMIAATFGPRAWQRAGNGDGGGDTGDMIYDQAIPEVIGDFTGDGNLDKEDWRYFMDGLYIDGASGNLNREAAAIAVDNAILAYAAANLPGDPASWLPWGLGSDVRWPESAPEWVSTDGDRCQEKTVELPGGSFGRGMLMGARPYQPGDFRADVAGRPTSKGAAPTGADGVIDEADLAYVVANAGDWTDLFEAVEMDLSCDMNGDLKVDGLDVEFVKSILHPAGGAGPSCPPGDIRNGPDCGTDGDVNLNDILGVLDEFSGDRTCCDVSAAGHADPGAAAVAVPARAVVTLVPRQSVVAPGEVFEIDVYADELGELSAYQVSLKVVGGLGSQLEALTPVIDLSCSAPVFAYTPSIHVVNQERQRIAGIAVDGSAETAGSVCLGTFVYRALDNARGTFRIVLVGRDTLLLDAGRQAIGVRASVDATIAVR